MKQINPSPTITKRLFTGGFQPMCRVTHPADTRTAKQITDTIDAYGIKIPEIKQFINEIKSLSPKHMGLIADTLELSDHYEFLMNGIDLNKEVDGTCARDEIIKELIKASKDNPEAMELVEAIINNTDSVAAKYSLVSLLGGVLQNKDAAKHMKETAKIVPKIADKTLSGGYLGTYEKENNFVNWLFRFINPQTRPDKITSLYDDVVNFTNKRPETFPIYVDEYLESDTPLERIRENLEILPQVLEHRKSSDNFNIVSFITRNTNLK